MTCKHKHGGQTSEAETDEKEECEFTVEMLAMMVNEVKQLLIDNNVFSKNIRKELRAYTFANIAEKSDEFNELQKVYKHLIKKKD